MIVAVLLEGTFQHIDTDDCSTYAKCKFGRCGLQVGSFFQQLITYKRCRDTKPDQSLKKEEILDTLYHTLRMSSRANEDKFEWYLSNFWV